MLDDSKNIDKSTMSEKKVDIDCLDNSNASCKRPDLFTSFLFKDKLTNEGVTYAIPALDRRNES